jgi:hypothetical protein
MGGLMDRRRVRSPASALMELSVLANERQRLELELERCKRRQAEIAARFVEIAAKEVVLHKFVKEPPPAVVPARPAPGPLQRFRATDFSY